MTINPEQLYTYKPLCSVRRTQASSQHALMLTASILPSSDLRPVSIKGIQEQVIELTYVFAKKHFQENHEKREDNQIY